MAPSIPSVVVVLCGLVILVGLGFWQLDRAQQKRLILANYATQTSNTTVLNQLPANQAILPFQVVSLTGTFINDMLWLLDNKFHHNTAGYHVITPFLLKNSAQVILVNRGFIPRGEQRTQLPQIQPITEEHTITGLLQQPQHSFILGDPIEQVATEQMTHQVLLIQSLDFNQLSALLGKPLYPAVLLLDKASPFGFIREWNPIVMSPNRHIGYAAQWFLLATTLLLAFVFTCCITSSTRLKEKN